MNNNNETSSHVYLSYVQNHIPCINSDTLEYIARIIDQTSWDDPQSSSDWNNIAVTALTEAENCGDHDQLELRLFYLQLAIESLENGLSIDNNPICIINLANIYSMIDEVEKCLDLINIILFNAVKLAYTQDNNSPHHYLIFLPPDRRKLSLLDQKNIENILCKTNIYDIALCIATEILYRTQPFFCNYENIRYLYLAFQLQPNSVNLGLRLGISNFKIDHVQEAILFLHQTNNLLPDYSLVIQSLYLLYKDLQQVELSQYWHEIGKQFSEDYKNNGLSLDCQWTELKFDNYFTYVAFQDNLTLAVESSLKSIVTSTIISEKDWFEKEIEFWRSYLQPGMTVIDVGANVGVYTFSAAEKVGKTGKVIAVEPFSLCVECLEKTCEINQFSWVTIYGGAASSSNGKIKLLLNPANELNQVVFDGLENANYDNFQEIPCFTLDSIVEKENLEKIDFLKLDAEGHEMEILAGSQELIKTFSPVILYENIAGSSEANLQLSAYLVDIGYEIFSYQPYTKQLISVKDNPDYQKQLNLIAIPPEKLSIFNLIDE